MRESNEPGTILAATCGSSFSSSPQGMTVHDWGPTGGYPEASSQIGFVYEMSWVMTYRWSYHYLGSTRGTTVLDSPWKAMSPERTDALRLVQNFGESHSAQISNDRSCLGHVSVKGSRFSIRGSGRVCGPKTTQSRYGSHRWRKRRGLRISGTLLRIVY